MTSQPSSLPQTPTQFQASCQQYMATNKLRPLFSQLTRQLVLQRPSDPLDYLIRYLSQRRRRRQIICIVGWSNRDRVAQAVAGRMGWKVVKVEGIDDSNSNEEGDSPPNSQPWGDKGPGEEAKRTKKLLAQLDALSPEYKGVVISGYPANATEADQLRKSRHVPDRYFILNVGAKKAQIGQYLNKKGSNWLNERRRLQLRELFDSLGDTLDYLNIGQADPSADNILTALSLRNRTPTPIESVRLIVLHPPYLVPAGIETLVNAHCFHHITLEGTIAKMSRKANFVDYVEKYIKRAQGVAKQVELALIQTECKSAAAKQKGQDLRVGLIN